MVLAKVASTAGGAAMVATSAVVRGKWARKGRLEILPLDAAERRHAEGAGPVGQQGVVGAGGKGLAFLILSAVIWDLT